MRPDMVINSKRCVFDIQGGNFADNNECELYIVYSRGAVLFCCDEYQDARRGDASREGSLGH